MRILAATSALLLLTAARGVAPTASQSLHRHFSQSDRENGRYQYLPFDVPAGTASLTISYRYSGDTQGTSTIDLGLFEPGPLTLGTASFRGYSGGAQRTISVGTATASPGYRAGRMPAGTWHLLLGLYKVALEGVDVDVEIVTSPKAQHEAVARGLEQPDGSGGTGGATTPTAGRAPRWYSGGLHLHTNHSDGTIGPARLAAIARDAGLDFISITDHNNTTWTREPMPASPLAIVGEEVTTPAGHADVWGLPRGAWIDFRVMPSEPGATDRINGIVEAAHHAGALFSLNHPFGECGGCSWQQTIPAGVDAIEIWNGEHGPQPEAVALWDRLLAAGRHVTGVGASDWHRTPAPVDAAAVRVLANGLTGSHLLQSLREGRVVVMRDAKTAPPVVSARCGSQSAAIGDTLRCSAGDTITVGVDMPDLHEVRAALVVNGATRESWTLRPHGGIATPAVDGYLRVHIYDGNGGAIALTNPIYVSAR